MAGIRTVLGMVTAAVAIGLGCGSVQAAQSPVDLEPLVATWVAHGQWGKLYDLMPPAQQQVIPYAKWYRCTLAGLLVAKGFGVDARSVKFVSAKVRPNTRPMTLPGTRVRVIATVVSSTASLMEGGKRVLSTATDYWVELDGKWRRIDPNVVVYSRGNCGR
jgi:hypothetical protein